MLHRWAPIRGDVIKDQACECARGSAGIKPPLKIVVGRFVTGESLSVLLRQVVMGL
jgi:hypothetical protein